MIPGCKKKITISRIQSALCHVMCDYCNFEHDKCIANRKDLFFRFITDNLKPVKN